MRTEANAQQIRLRPDTGAYTLIPEVVLLEVGPGEDWTVGAGEQLQVAGSAPAPSFGAIRAFTYLSTGD